MDGLFGLLQQHRKGITHQEISDSLRDMVAAVTDAQKGGKIVITFGISPMGKGDGLEVTIETKITMPKEKPGRSVFYATPENNLVREDPRQQNMELREVGTAAVARNLA